MNKKLIINSILSFLLCSNLALSDTLGTKQTQNKLSEKSWITIGSDAVDFINRNHQKSIQFDHTNQYYSASNSVALVSIPSNQIDLLSELMHDEFNRCGGFIFHDSLAQAHAYSQSLKQLQPAAAISYSIDNPATVSALTAELNSANLTSTVNTLSAYHNRYYTQQTGVDAANWIKNQWSTIAADRGDISVELFDHSWQQSSVIATIIGSSNETEIVIIGGHLDSINQSNPSSGRAPGSDDNASGIAVLTETLRAIVASGYQPARTIKLMAFAAEEVGLRGSNAIAQNYKSSNQNVIGMVQFDMTGYKGTSNKDIVFMTDYTNDGQNQFMAQLITTYIPSISYGFDQCGYGCSDHASWFNQGYATSMPFESNMNDYNSKIHSSNDNTFDANHASNFAKLSLAYVAELAKGSTDGTPPPPPPPEDDELSNGVSKTGLSASTGNDLTYTFAVPADANSIVFQMSGGTGDADLYVKYGSAPSDSIYDCRPYKNGNIETCNGSQAGGIYYVRIKAYSSFANVSITASYSNTPPPPDEKELQNGVAKTNLSATRGSDLRFYMNVPSGSNNIQFNLSGGSGDADLYVRYGAEPTDSAYDCRPYKNGNIESCNGSQTGGTYFIRIKAYSTFSGVSIQGNYN